MILKQWPVAQEAEADDRMKSALNEIEMQLRQTGSPHPAIMQEFFSEYGVEKLKVCTAHIHATLVATLVCNKLLDPLHHLTAYMSWQLALAVWRKHQHAPLPCATPFELIFESTAQCTFSSPQQASVAAAAQELAFGPQPGFPTEGAGRMFSDWSRQLQKETDALQAAIADYERNVEGAAKRKDFTAQGPTRRVLFEWYPVMVDAVQREQQAVGSFAQPNLGIVTAHIQKHVLTVPFCFSLGCICAGRCHATARGGAMPQQVMALSAVPPP